MIWFLKLGKHLTKAAIFRRNRRKSTRVKIQKTKPCFAIFVAWTKKNPFASYMRCSNFKTMTHQAFNLTWTVRCCHRSSFMQTFTEVCVTFAVTVKLIGPHLFLFVPFQRSWMDKLSPKALALAQTLCLWLKIIVIWICLLNVRVYKSIVLEISRKYQ